MGYQAKDDGLCNYVVHLRAVVTKDVEVRAASPEEAVKLVHERRDRDGLGPVDLRPEWAEDIDLRGARYGLAVLHTSPAVRGRALELLRDLVREIDDEEGKRVPEGVDGDLRRALDRYADEHGSHAGALEFAESHLRRSLGGAYDRPPVLFRDEPQGEESGT